jgi:hypothetical protein
MNSVNFLRNDSEPYKPNLKMNAVQILDKKITEERLKELMEASGRNPDYDENKAFRTNENKLRYDLCPAIAQREYAKVWTEGLKKYPARNWEKGFPFSEVIASAMRHLEAIRLGEEIDPEDGLLHSAHLMCNAAMLTEFYFTHPELNDLQKQIK